MSLILIVNFVPFWWTTVRSGVMFNKFHANHPGFSKPFVFLRRSWPLSCSVQIFCWIKIGLYRFCSVLLHFIMWNGDKKRLVWLDRGACITRGKVPVFFLWKETVKMQNNSGHIFKKMCCGFLFAKFGFFFLFITDPFCSCVYIFKPSAASVKNCTETSLWRTDTSNACFKKNKKLATSKKN